MEPRTSRRTGCPAFAGQVTHVRPPANSANQNSMQMQQMRRVEAKRGNRDAHERQCA